MLWKHTNLEIARLLFHQQLEFQSLSMYLIPIDFITKYVYSLFFLVCIGLGMKKTLNLECKKGKNYLEENLICWPSKCPPCKLTMIIYGKFEVSCIQTQESHTQHINRKVLRKTCHLTHEITSTFMLSIIKFQPHF